MQTEATITTNPIPAISIRSGHSVTRTLTDEGYGRIDPTSIGTGWLDGATTGQSLRLTPFLNRLGDVLASLVLLIIAAPLMVLVTALIRWDSAGPALYRQVRVGLDGRTFTLLKFRSMRVDAEAAGPAWASLRDPRVTRIGGFIRRTRIDELPQLFNVLGGEMSLIGPRPERPHFLEHLTSEIPNFRERLQVKPGLTGWAQVNFRYGASIEDARVKLSYDLYYVKHRSLLLDLKILLLTVRVMLFQEGSR